MIVILYLYDNAIVENLRDSFHTTEDGKPVVCVVPPEDIISIAAQVQDDIIRFPLIAVARETNIPIDNELNNFTRRHQGVATTFDNVKNEIYYEKAIPLKLTYNLVCMATNTADVDELLRELLFKYSSQYFLNITVPYESKRKIRFGINVNPNEEIEWYSTTSNYLQEGKLHSAGIHLYVEGAVYLHYTPQKLRRLDYEIEPTVHK